MASKWRGELETENGSLDLEMKGETTNGRDKLRPTSINPETGNEISQKVVDSETGEEVGNSYYDCGRKIEIGDQTAEFDVGELRELKKAVVSDGFDIQKVIDEEEFDKARIDKTAYQMTPEEGEEKKYALLWHGLKSKSKVAVVKYAPSTSENLYAMWTDDRGIWVSQIVYPAQFEVEEVETPSLSDKMKDKAEKLVESMSEENQTDFVEDNQRQKLEEAIEKKLNGEELDVETEREKQEEEQLEDELEAVL